MTVIEWFPLLFILNYKIIIYSILLTDYTRPA